MSKDVFDLIVIGAGSVGTPTALQAALAGLSVLVIDGHPTAGQGEHKRAIGGIRATHSEPAKIALGLASLEFFSTFTERTGRQIHWRRGGYLFPAYTEKDQATLMGILNVQQRLGLDIRWIGSAEVREVAPGITSTNLRGGAYSPGDGSASPIDSMAAFYAEALAAGVKFRFGEQVERLEIAGERLMAVITDKDRYPCRHAVNAAGVGASAVAALAGADLPVRPDMHEAGITEPLGRFFDPMVVDMRRGPGSKNVYFYQNEEGQVVFCLTPDPRKFGDDHRNTSEFLPMMARRMVEVMPRLASARVRRIWRGLYPNSPDGSPIVDRDPHVEGLLHAAGLCGQGFMLGPAIGALVTRMLCGALAQEDHAVLRDLRLSRPFAGSEVLE